MKKQLLLMMALLLVSITSQAGTYFSYCTVNSDVKVTSSCQKHSLSYVEYTAKRLSTGSIRYIGGISSMSLAKFRNEFCKKTWKEILINEVPSITSADIGNSHAEVSLAACEEARIRESLR